MTNVSRKIKAVFIAIVCLGWTLTYTRLAQADFLSIRFETHGEEPPAELCILADFAHEKQLMSEHAIRQQYPGDDCHEISAISTPPSGVRFWCLNNTAGNGHGRAFLRVANAVVLSSELSRNVARLGVSPSREAKDKPAKVELLGGHYHDQSPLAFRLTDGTQIIEIPLVARCAVSHVALPEYSCAPGQAKGNWSVKGGTIVKSDASSIDLNVVNAKSGGGEVVLQDCGHTFGARFTGPAPPLRMELEVRKFWFKWARNCLAPEGCPARPLLVGAGVRCEFERDVDDAGQKPEPEPQEQPKCHYKCTGVAKFPANVQMSYTQASVTRSWTESLGVPGQTLSGYIPEDQRRVSLRWDWREPPCKRVGRIADEIEYVELRTPEGKLHRIQADAAQVRVPELDCGDYLSYRYVGTRAFREKQVPVQDGGAVVLEDPKHSRIDNFRLGALLGGGMRHTNGTGDVGWGPQGAVEVVVVFRHLRDLWSPMDVELRIGAMISDHPYCSRYVSDVNGTSCQKDDWERLPYWRFPMTAGLNFHLPLQLTWGFGVGLAPTTYHFSRDSSKISRPILGVMRTHLGYKVAGAVAFEAFVQLYWGEKVWETAFDRAGVRSGERREGASVTQIIGLVIRVDDLL